MKEAIRRFAEAVAEMYLAKSGLNYAAQAELEEFAGLLTAVDWSVEVQPAPPPGRVAGLRHLPNALAAAYAAGDCPVLDALRLCIGLTPWETYDARDAWAAPFLDDFVSGELIGPSGTIANRDISLGLFLLGPETTYTEHAHAAAEIYYVLGGGACWTLDRPDNAKAFAPGDLVYTAPDQRHDIKTGEQPLLAAWTWKADPGAPSYHRSGGPWRGGARRVPALVNRDLRQAG